ncbi:NB-ARC domain, LRR domain containing protein [Trema orientale]|uniref:NB-ARC domain, LRR domain containing protein n=1 Tax=Trema orientale TaxID=63057 RepID=A0A2P5ETS6_TREOI|nr:NB-ARC domain, LRR domain containing protein [Trema orientale]
MDIELWLESEDKYKWVRRQWRFLEAFSKDIRQIQDSVKEIKKIAPQQLRDSAELNLEGITVPLNEIETKWETIGGPNVASNAKRCLEAFEKLNADFLNRRGTESEACRPDLLGRPRMRSRVPKSRLVLAAKIGFYDLLNAKDEYGLTFVVRDSSKLVLLQQRNDVETDISSALLGIHKQLTEKVPKRISKSKYSKIFGKLRQELEALQQLLEDEKAAHEGATNTRSIFSELLEKIAFGAENCISTYLGGSVSLSELQPKFDEVVKLICFVQKVIQFCSIKVVKDSCFVVGLEEDVHELVSKLIPTNNGQDDDANGDQLLASPTIISIVGMEGIGKTTLAKEVLHHKSIISHFQRRSLVSVPQSSDETILLQTVGEEILGVKGKILEKDKWIKIMVDVFKKEPCLVVLDNLSSKKAWDVLKPAICSDGSKCTIILTTRDKAVASDAVNQSTSSIIHLRLRTEEESWEFFTQMVHCPSDVEKGLATKVVARTGGLPLAILRLGYRLQKATTKELSRVLEGISHGQNQTPWLGTWEMNKEDFQKEPILGKCFSYFEFFPRDFNIPSRRLVALWVASGVLKGADGGEKTREEVAADYLQELIDRNMIQVIKRKRNGEVKSCRFPSTLGDIWVRDRRNKKLPDRSWSLFASFDRQVAYRFDDNDASNGRSIHGLEYSSSENVLHEEKRPKSVMFFDTREGEKPGEEIGQFLLKSISGGNFRDLLVLDLEGVFRPHLPESLGKLKKLTYLGLRWTYLEALPSSMGNLSQLQTLDLKHTYVRTLPNSTWKLKKLRHLYLNQHCRIAVMPQPISSSMKYLQTLCGVVLDHKGSALTDGLGRLRDLRKLEVTILDSVRQESQEGFLKGIVNLTHLRVLRLRSINKKGEAQCLKLRPLSNLKQLTTLYLLGKLEQPSAFVSELPESLTELTLSATGLSEDPMPKLGSKLLGIKYLSFLSDSFEGTRMDFSGQDFPELLVLHIWNLSNLEVLDVQKGAMQKLRKFDVRKCQNLKVPTELSHLTLHELKV